MSYVAPANRHRAIVMGTLLTLGGLVLLASTTSSSNDARTFVLGALLSVGGVLRLVTAFSMDTRRLPRTRPRRARPMDASLGTWSDAASKQRSR